MGVAEPHDKPNHLVPPPGGWAADDLDRLPDLPSHRGDRQAPPLNTPFLEHSDDTRRPVAPMRHRPVPYGTIRSNHS